MNWVRRIGWRIPERLLELVDRVVAGDGPEVVRLFLIGGDRAGRRVLPGSTVRYSSLPTVPEFGVYPEKRVPTMVPALQEVAAYWGPHEYLGLTCQPWGAYDHNRLADNLYWYPGRQPNEQSKPPHFLMRFVLLLPLDGEGQLYSAKVRKGETWTPFEGDDCLLGELIPGRLDEIWATLREARTAIHRGRTLADQGEVSPETEAHMRAVYESLPSGSVTVTRKSTPEKEAP